MPASTQECVCTHKPNAHMPASTQECVCTHKPNTHMPASTQECVCTHKPNAHMPASTQECVCTHKPNTASLVFMFWGSYVLVWVAIISHPHNPIPLLATSPLSLLSLSRILFYPKNPSWLLLPPPTLHQQHQQVIFHPHGRHLGLHSMRPLVHPSVSSAQRVLVLCCQGPPPFVPRMCMHQPNRQIPLHILVFLQARTTITATGLASIPTQTMHANHRSTTAL